MNSLSFYIKLGFEHISDFAGYDHMLFLVALCAIYRIQQWKSIMGIKKKKNLDYIELSFSVKLRIKLFDLIRFIILAA